MPKVPEYGGAQVTPGVAPSVRFSAPKADNPAGQVDAFAKGVESLARAVTPIEQDIRRRADQVRLDDFGAQAKSLQTQYELEALSLKGKAALDRPDGKSLWEDSQERLRADLEKLEKGLGNQNQREAARSLTTQISGDMGNRIMGHMVGEQKALETETRGAVVSTATQRASVLHSDPAAVQEASDAVRLTVMQQLKADGLDGDKNILDDRVVKAMSPLHSGVLRGQIDSGQLTAAKEYFSTHSAEMSPQAQKNIHDAIHNADVKDRSLRLSLEMQDTGTLKEQKAAANALFLKDDIDAEVRDALVSRLEHNAAGRKASRVEYENSIVGQAQDFLLQNPSATLNDMPSSLYTALKNSGKLGNISNFAKDNRYTTDPLAWKQLTATTSGELAGMTEDEFFNTYRGSLSDAEYNKGLELLKDAKNPGGTLSLATRIKNASYKVANVDLGTKASKLSAGDAERIAMFQEDLDRRVQDFLTGQPPGAKVSPTDLDGIVAQARIDMVRVDEWGTDPSRPVGALRMDEMEDAYIRTADGRDVYLSFVSPDYREEAIARIRTRGLPVTESLIAEMWAMDNPRTDDE